MAEREIERSGWSEFLTDFLRRHETWLVDVDTFRAPAGQAEEIARGVHVNGIAVSDGAVEVRLRLSENRELVHRIEEAGRVRHLNTGDGRVEEVHLQGRSAATALRFRSGAQAGATDDHPREPQP